MEPINKLFEIIQSKANPSELDWIHSKSQLDAKGISYAFVATPRFIRKSFFSLDLTAVCDGWKLNEIALDQFVRIYFIAQIGEKTGSEETFVRQINLLFETAEMNEAIALYTAFPIISYPEKWLLKATDAVRSNIGSIFDAIAFGNPYPAKYFSELAWNQLVLKCIFNDKPIHRIYGLDKRSNQHLADTLSDFAHERWAADRRVPSQVWRLVSRFITPSLVKDLEQLLLSNNERDIIAGKIVLHESNSTLLNSLRDKYIHSTDSNLDWSLLEEPEPIYTA